MGSKNYKLQSKNMFDHTAESNKCSTTFRILNLASNFCGKPKFTNHMFSDWFLGFWLLSYKVAATTEDID